MLVLGFESIFEKCLRLGELCNNSHLYKNAYKVLTFENISFENVSVFERCFKDVFVKCVFESDFEKVSL